MFTIKFMREIKNKGNPNLNTNINKILLVLIKKNNAKGDTQINNVLMKI